MLTKEEFIQLTGLQDERVDQLFNDIKERFGEDLKSASEYLEKLVIDYKRRYE